MVKNEELEKLIRLVAEVDDLEHQGTVAGPPASVFEPLRREHVSPPRRFRGLFVTLSVLGAAAVLLLAIFLKPPQVPELLSTREPGPRSEADPVIQYVEGSRDQHDSRTDRFEFIAEEPCAVLALLRTWSADCECLSWRLHQWRDGLGLSSSRSTIGPGERVFIDLDVTDNPPIDQYLVVVTAPRAEDLPVNPAEAEELLSCLHDVVPEKLPDVDFAADIPPCLPSGVQVVAKTFRVR